MKETVQSEDDDPLVLAVAKLGAAHVDRRPGRLLFVVAAPMSGGEIQVLRTRFMGDYGSICQMTFFAKGSEQGEVTFAPTAQLTEAIRTRGAVGVEAVCAEWIAKGKKR